MKPAPFDYLTPTSVDETLAILREHGDDAKVLAGGQSLVPMLNFRLARPEVLVDINRVAGLDGLEVEDGALRIGAMVRHRALENHLSSAEGAWGLLGEAVGHVGHVHIRTRGTVGGSLAHADPAAELPALVRALDGVLVARGPQGDRAIPAAEFFTGLLSTSLGPGELLAAVRLPLPDARCGYAVEEFTRRAGDFAIVAAIAAVELDGAGRTARVRVAIAGAGPAPVRLAKVEAALGGVEPSERVFRQVLKDHALEIEPGDDVHASAEYRRHLTRVLTVRALLRASARAAQEGRA